MWSLMASLQSTADTRLSRPLSSHTRIHKLGDSGKQLDLHPLARHGPAHDLPHNVRARGEIVLKDGLPLAPHVEKNSLAKVPSEQLVRRASGVIKQLAVEMGAGDAAVVGLETHYFVVVLG